MTLPKLVACDIDGTLIPYGKREMPGKIYPIISRLLDKGVMFCPASGRQYHSLRLLFAPVADRICYVCENGGVVFGRGAEETAPILSKTPMPRKEAVELAREMVECPDSDVLISGERTCYVCAWSEEMRRDMARLNNRVVLVDDPDQVEEEIIKVSAFCAGGTGPVAGKLGPRWGDRFRMAVAGPTWMDFTLSDKGTGIRGLCTALGVAMEDVMAFGDNWNDLQMLSLVGQPWIMDTSDEELKKKIPKHCSNVVEVLEQLLEENP